MKTDVWDAEIATDSSVVINMLFGLKSVKERPEQSETQTRPLCSDLLC